MKYAEYSGIFANSIVARARQVAKESKCITDPNKTIFTFDSEFMFDPPQTGIKVYVWKGSYIIVENEYLQEAA
jgi:hypothetical protein